MPKINLDFLPRSLTPSQTALLTLWVLLMISFPIVDWALGWDAMLSAVVLSLLAQLVAVVLILWQAWGATKTLGVGLTILILGWAAEALGSHTGFPFGAYSYTDALQPQIFNVPLQIPLGWLMMMPPSWAVAQAIANRIKPGWQFPAFIGLSALAMTAWDLLMDPMMVAWGMWVWDDPWCLLWHPLGQFPGLAAGCGPDHCHHPTEGFADCATPAGLHHHLAAHDGRSGDILGHARTCFGGWSGDGGLGRSGLARIH